MSAGSDSCLRIKPLRMAWLLAAFLAAYSWARAADDLDLDLDLEKEDTSVNKMPAETGGMLFRFADAKQPAKDLSERLFWRILPDCVAASAAPIRLEMDGSDVIAPTLNPNPPPGQQEYLYPISGRAKIEQGEHILTPFNLSFTLEGKDLKSDHPALAFGRGEVIIRCAPVRFEITDENGAPAAAAIAINLGKDQLLREAKAFSLLVAWLPVGLSYDSTAGKFNLDAEGKIAAPAAGLAKNVSAIAGGFRLTVRETAPRRRQPGKRSVGLGNVGTFETTRFFVTPLLVKPGEKIYLGLPKAAADKELEHVRCLIDVARPSDFFYDLAWQRTAAPSAADEQAAAAALGEKELTWLAITAPADYLGVLPFALQFKKGHVWRHKVIIAEAGSGLALLPHRLRPVFEQGEDAWLYAFIAPGHKGGTGKIVAAETRAKEAEMLLGEITLPANTGEEWDSRLFRLQTAALAPGEYRLRLTTEGAASQSLRLAIVPPVLARSPFYVHTMSGCTEWWPTDDKGLTILRQAGLEMGTATGFWSMLNTCMPAIDRAAADILDGDKEALPPEAAISLGSNDILLTRLLRHGMRMIDLAVVRALPFYNEGLSYHHSYPPSVARMIRRMQIFTQQTGEYPSWLGINYSWFPAWWGYVEGGVPTDAHTADRNAALAAAVKKAGGVDLSDEERQWYKQHGAKADQAEKALALLQKAVKFWTLREDLAWGKHNKIYNAAVREVRAQTVCTLFDNAGHDTGKRLAALYNDMAAACYESYTDYGEWPMSAAFTTDWARAHRPDRCVWLTVDWGTTSEGAVKSLFHAFARGLAGGGMPMQKSHGERELERRGTALDFLSRFGAIAIRAKPDNRFAILATAAHIVMRGGHAVYDYHALYYHLTRLGYAPIILSEDEVASSGIPDEVKVLFLVREKDPLTPALQKTIRDFLGKGGKVLATADCASKPASAETLAIEIKNLWQVGGFERVSHAAMWGEFDACRATLSAALAKTGVPPLATSDPDRAVVVTMVAKPVRYVVAIAEKKGAYSGEFAPVENLPLSIEGTGWIIRDLARQATLKTEEQNGRTLTSIDLVTEPAVILACLPALPEKIALKAEARLGDALVACGEVQARDGAPLGPVPVTYTIADPRGEQRAVFHRAAGDILRFPLAARDLPGEWRISIQESLSGLTATAVLKLEARESAPAVADAGDVQIIQEEQVRAFASRPQEKWVMVEPGQERLLPLAQKIVAGLQAAGKKARLWQVKVEEFDTIPLRWYLRPEDEAKLRLVEEGRLVGYRGNMEPYIDRRAGAHDPQKGGWSDIDPPYMVGSDCIIFSGGRLAESLRAVSAWLNTPHTPGRGQGRLLVAFSPFLADRQAVAVIANDQDGLTKAVERLLALCTASAPPAPSAAASEPALKPLAPKLETQPVVHRYLGYAPLRLATGIHASKGGGAAVFLRGKENRVVALDAAGKVAAAWILPGSDAGHALMDENGGLWHYRLRKANEEGESAVIAQCLTAEGSAVCGGEVFAGDAREIAAVGPYWTSFPVSPNGKFMLLARQGGFWLGNLPTGPWLRYDDVENLGVVFEARRPRFPIGATFSPDSAFLFLTLDTRPQPYGNMNMPNISPSGAESLLLELATGKILWRLRDRNPLSGAYAAGPGFAAVSAGGELTAIADFNGMAYLVNKSGQIIAKVEAMPKPPKHSGWMPPGGIGVWMDEKGTIAAFGYANLLLLAQGRDFIKVALSGLVSGGVTRDGSLAIAALDDGTVKAFARDGAEKWSVAAKGGPAFVAPAAGDSVWVATSAGEVMLLDSAGQELKRVNAAAAAQQAKPINQTPPASKITTPVEYREPDTLAIARRILQAKQIAAWQATGAGREIFGKKFHAAAQPITLSAGDAKEAFVHLVYRRPNDNKSLRIIAKGRDGAETFVLDLPTPEYRVVDIPLFGPGAAAEVRMEGAIEVAECSLWSFAWPGANLAFVRQAGPGSAADILDDETVAEPDSKVAEQELEDGATTGSMKNCEIWWPNTDIDRVQGAWLRPAVAGLEMVDGKRFGNGKLAPWAGKGAKGGNFFGAWLTIDFGKKVPVRLVATYDRTNLQSEVATGLAAYVAESMKGDDYFGHDRAPVIRAAIANDQFWRLLLPSQPREVKILGIMAHNNRLVGLSEVEVY